MFVLDDEEAGEEKGLGALHHASSPAFSNKQGPTGKQATRKRATGSFSGSEFVGVHYKQHCVHGSLSSDQHQLTSIDRH